MQPSFGPVCESLFKESPGGKNLTGTVSLGKDQWTSGQCRILKRPHSLHAFSSLVILVIHLAVLVSFFQ